MGERKARSIPIDRGRPRHSSLFWLIRAEADRRVRRTSCWCACVAVTQWDLPNDKIRPPCLQIVEQVGGIKEISLGNNNRHHISVAAKIILLSLVGCLTSRMGVNPPTFYLVCVETADYLLPTHAWPSVATSNRQEMLFGASCISRADIKAIETKVELDHRNDWDSIKRWLIFMRSSRKNLTNISSWLEGGTEAAVDVWRQSWYSSRSPTYDIKWQRWPVRWEESGTNTSAAQSQA